MATTVAVCSGEAESDGAMNDVADTEKVEAGDELAETAANKSISCLFVVHVHGYSYNSLALPVVMKK